MKRTSQTFLALLSFGMLRAPLLHADVQLASLFTDHTVLQQGMSTPIWGTATPGEKVTVTLNDQHAEATTDANGKWTAHLDNLKAGGPYDVTIAGTNTLTLKDVYIGEVWLCSGQSNMDFTVAKTPKYSFAGAENEATEVAAANYPQIRMFSGEWSREYTPQTKIEGTWKICNPENVREFSAIGYFFARDLQQKLHVPVGIVTMTYGASTAQSWIRREALEANPTLAPMLTTFDEAVAKFKALPPSTLPAEEVPTSAPSTEPTKADLAKAAAAKKKKGPKDPVKDQHNPTVMYNGMIAPMIPYGIKGVLWYQGESITGDKTQFPLINETLITDWRKLWNNPHLPFYFCQLAALNNASNSPTVRAMQAEALKLPDTAMAVTIDIGNPKSVHPKNKQDVGDRLMRIALANAYGQDIEYSGPVADTMKVDGDKIRVTFTHAKGLAAKGDTELKTFEIAGADGKFVPATATIDGSDVIISSPDIKDPTAVRYAWANNPAGCNLINSDKLPAAPFQKSK